jgi:hypothetical protein
MSSRRSVAVKAVVTVEAKSISQQMDGIRRAIDSGLVDAQTIIAFKRLLNPKPPSITLSTNPRQTTKSSSLASARGKKPASASTVNVAAPDAFPSVDWVSATKTIVMKSVTALAAEIESRVKKVKHSEDKARAPVSQGTRNVAVCCKLALEALRQYQGHQDAGVGWVNKAYCAYIAKLLALEMVSKTWSQTT